MAGLTLYEQFLEIKFKMLQIKEILFLQDDVIWKKSVAAGVKSHLLSWFKSEHLKGPAASRRPQRL